MRQVGLPPLVGFLAAGFVLQACGVEGGETLQTIADLGVQLLLFSIGLKLNLRRLLRPEIARGRCFDARLFEKYSCSNGL